MKLLIISDSHGTTGNIVTAIELEAPDVLVFLGDCVRDLECVYRQYPNLVVYAVRGNCDFAGEGELRRVEELDGERIFITHGHEYGVKYTLGRAVNTACCAGATMLFYGHTHEPYLAESCGLTVLNPGAMTDGRYAVVRTGGAVSVELKTLAEKMPEDV